MDCLNLCVVPGSLERDPALRYREDGTAQCPCTIRVEDVGTNGTVYKTYVVAEAFGKTAEVLAELHSGAVVMVQGKLFWRKHITKSGEEKSGLALLAQKINMLVPAAVLAGSSH
jgi:single-stranded DNA-binding protein